uniref:Uncharacterized protein n=1 Tax=Pipistrellus kuhlii TaxID=59472 RepID=A0A7J7XV28_PIPKU|nr:hypothetical protein mPipKuh1_010471 [Pipistrellus kuhlii]
MPNCSPASLIAPNCLPLQAWSPTTALPCRPGSPPTALSCRSRCPQLPSSASLVTPNCPPLQAWSLPTALPCWPSCGNHLVSTWGQPSYCWSESQFAYYSFIRQDFQPVGLRHTGVPQEFLKHVLPDNLVRGTHSS